MSQYGDWCTPKRDEFLKKISAIPAWKRMILAFTRRKQWRLARAYTAVAIDMIRANDAGCHMMIARSDENWAKLYDISP